MSGSWKHSAISERLRVVEGPDHFLLAKKTYDRLRNLQSFRQLGAQSRTAVDLGASAHVSQNSEAELQGLEDQP